MPPGTGEYSDQSGAFLVWAQFVVSVEPFKYCSIDRKNLGSCFRCFSLLFTSHSRSSAFNICHQDHRCCCLTTRDPPHLLSPSSALPGELQQPCLQLRPLAPSYVKPDFSCAETILDKLPPPQKPPRKLKTPASKLCRRLQRASAEFKAPLARPSLE